ncbi:MAG: tRNA dihydrouridine(20/20a) synthase DusA [Gammaproteobacteria bacterium]|nr:tRNA dihydrouridine(20/20a) synthase DusA [Gammaproteobacteria bacterium]
MLLSPVIHCHDRDLFSVAPMIDCTDRHFRYLARLISRKTMLYTEMLTIKEILCDKTGYALQLNAIEHPVGIQLGGSDPALLAHCTQLAVQEGYDEINLNVGCPSDKVQQGGIGACLMLQPKTVAACIEAMVKIATVPVTVKCRLGVDDHDSYEHLAEFIKVVSAQGCSKFIIHARKAWLKGLSPKQNREIPPLDYERAYRLKTDFPHLTIVLNGGIQHFDEVDSHLVRVDGVMLGRAIYNNPYMLHQVDSRYFGGDVGISEEAVVLAYMNYVENELVRGTKLTAMTRHLVKLFHKKPKASYWRKYLGSNGSQKGAGVEIIQQALEQMQG